MARYFPPKKSPLLAALLGIIPGLGHLYNEQVGKGIFLIALFFGIPLLLMMSMMDFSFFPFIAPGFYHGTVFGGISEHPALLSRLFVVFMVCVFLPILIVYSMADAAATSAKINRGEIPLGGYPTVAPPPPPHQSVHTQSAHYAQEATTMNTSQYTGATADSAFAGSGAQTHTANESTIENGTNPPYQEHTSKQGRLILAAVLIALGFFSMVDDWEISFLRIDNFIYLFWPLVPLFFGLRLLHEYQLERNYSQKVLGIIFTVFGGVFLVNNWTDLNVFELLGDYWYLIPLVVGFMILFKDFKEKRVKKQAPKNGGQSRNKRA